MADKLDDIGICHLKYNPKVHQNLDRVSKLPTFQHRRGERYRTVIVKNDDFLLVSAFFSIHVGR